MPRSASVVVRTFNSGATLEACLDSLAKQTVRPEVVVVDSGSSDETLEIARRRADQLVTIPQTEFSFGGALNRGAAVASEPFHFALSSHCVARSPEWIAQSLGYYERPSVAATNGQLRFPDGTPLQDVFEMSEDVELSNPMWSFSNHASSWRASVWEEFPFNEVLVACEDAEWSDRVMRAGHTIIYDPKLLVPNDHRHREGMGALFRRTKRETLGMADFREVTTFTVRGAIERWWTEYEPGAKRPVQLVNPFRMAALLGQLSALRVLRRRAR